MPQTDEIGTGELSRAVSLIRGDIATLRADVGQRPDWQDVKRVEDGLIVRIDALTAATNTKNALQDKAIAALEGWQVWALRLGGPAMVALGVGVLLGPPRVG